ncbi:Nn.00g057130.m01.CDS01 [Neocucurbitaria sp. VM-36]
MAIGIFTILAGLVALAGAYLYFFGLSPETKRKLENQALKTMGENKMSYMAKDQINKIPSSNQEDVKNLKKGISNLAGGAMQNPIGEQAVRAATQVWDTAQNYSKDTLEHVDWNTVHGYTKGALERVSTMTGMAQGKVVEKTQ